MQRDIQLGGIVAFHQHRHAEGKGDRLHLLHLCQRERIDDQQDGVGAHGAGFIHLPGIDQEILAQHRQRTGGARRAQVIGRALEEGLVGQHRKAGRAVAFIVDSDLGGVEIGTDHALGRAGLLDFGDDRRLASADFSADRRGEVARRRLRLGLGTHGGQRLGGLAGRDLLALYGEYFLKDVCRHQPNFLVKAMNSSSFLRAAPLAMVSRALAMPAPIESARLAV